MQCFTLSELMMKSRDFFLFIGSQRLLPWWARWQEKSRGLWGLEESTVTCKGSWWQEGGLVHVEHTCCWSLVGQVRSIYFRWEKSSSQLRLDSLESGAFTSRSYCPALLPGRSYCNFRASQRRHQASAEWWFLFLRSGVIQAVRGVQQFKARRLEPGEDSPANISIHQYPVSAWPTKVQNLESARKQMTRKAKERHCTSWRWLRSQTYRALSCFRRSFLMD